jgi:hypothetical protein
VVGAAEIGSWTSRSTCRGYYKDPARRKILVGSWEDMETRGLLFFGDLCLSWGEPSPDADRRLVAGLSHTVSGVFVVQAHGGQSTRFQMCDKLQETYGGCVTRPDCPTIIFMIKTLHDARGVGGPRRLQGLALAGQQGTPDINLRGTPPLIWHPTTDTQECVLVVLPWLKRPDLEYCVGYCSWFGNRSRQFYEGHPPSPLALSEMWRCVDTFRNQMASRGLTSPRFPSRRKTSGW